MTYNLVCLNRGLITHIKPVVNLDGDLELMSVDAVLLTTKINK
jgi:hypothetical protein